MGAGASASEIALSIEEARRSGISDADIREYCRVHKLRVPEEHSTSTTQAAHSNGPQQQLVAMGFDPDAACAALLNNADLESAIRWLCEHPEAAAVEPRPQPPEQGPSRDEKTSYVATAASILQRRRDHALTAEDAELVDWSFAVHEVQRREAKAADAAKFAQRWTELGREYAEKTSQSASWKTSAPNEGCEKELASLLRRADVANAEAKMHRDDVMRFCRNKVIGSTALEKVYLYLKDKVHNNEPLAERDVKQSIFVALEIDEDGADLVPKIIELILVEEDELVLKRLINRLVATTSGSATKGARNDDTKYESKNDAVAATTQDAQVRGSLEYDASWRANADAAADELRVRLEAERAKARAALEARRRRRNRSVDEPDEGMVDLSSFAEAQAKAELRLRSRLGAERERARAALEERLRRRQVPHDEAERLRDEMEDMHDDVLMAGLRSLASSNLGRRDISFDDARQLCASHAELESRLRLELEASRERARKELRARASRRGGKSSNDHEMARFEAQFDSVATHTAVGTRAITDACAVPSVDEAAAAARLESSAAELLRRLAADESELEGRFVVAQSHRSAALRRRIAQRGNKELLQALADDERESTAQELEGISAIQSKFCGATLGWARAAGGSVDASAVVGLVARHEAARGELADRLAAQALRRRAALLERIRRDPTEAELSELDRELHEDKWRQLNELVASQQKGLLAVIQTEDETSSFGAATNLRAAYDRVASTSAADRSVVEGLRSGLRLRATANSGREAAAALIEQQAIDEESKEATWLTARAEQQAALRQRLKARCAVATDVDVDDLADYAALEDDMDAKELDDVAATHSRFCGEAAAIADNDAKAAAKLVADHDAALRRLGAEIAADHKRRRVALLAQVAARKHARKEDLASDVDTAFSRLDAELRDDRRSRLRAATQQHRAAVLASLNSNATSEEGMFKALCDNETAAHDRRLQRESTVAERQRQSIERRLAERASRKKSLVGHIEEARKRHATANQLHAQWAKTVS